MGFGIQAVVSRDCGYQREVMCLEKRQRRPRGFIWFAWGVAGFEVLDVISATHKKHAKHTLEVMLPAGRQCLGQQ